MYTQWRRARYAMEESTLRSGGEHATQWRRAHYAVEESTLRSGGEHTTQQRRAHYAAEENTLRNGGETLSEGTVRHIILIIMLLFSCRVPNHKEDDHKLDV